MCAVSSSQSVLDSAGLLPPDQIMGACITQVGKRWLVDFADRKNRYVVDPVNLS